MRQRKNELEDKTIEELLDFEMTLLEKRVEDEPTAIYALINLYQVLLKKTVKEKDYSYLKEMVKANLVKHLIWYGTYVKTVIKKDDRVAEDSLKKALFYNNQLPIAHYRLGFLAYRRKEYTKALVHFEQAIELHKRGNDTNVQLTDLQQYNAHLYLTNSALYIAQATHQSLDKLSSEDYGPLNNYELSPFFDIITSNEEYLLNKAYTIVDGNGKSFCKKEEAERHLESEDTFILYFGDKENIAYYNRKETALTLNHAEMLRYILLCSREDRPATKVDMADVFQIRDIPNNTVRRRMSRLKEKLQEIGFPTDCIQSKGSNEMPGYFFTGTIPFLIIHRTDADFILSV